MFCGFAPSGDLMRLEAVCTSFPYCILIGVTSRPRFVLVVMQVFVYKGRAAMPLRGVVGRFAKVFFKPRDSPVVYGRVDVMLRPISDRIYSNFLACSIERTVVPGLPPLTQLGASSLPGSFTH